MRKNPTKAEAILWNRLRARQLDGVKFRRQQPIHRFIVDLVSFEKRIIIELDGGQHAMNKDKDQERDRILTDKGFYNENVIPAVAKRRAGIHNQFYCLDSRFRWNDMKK